MPGLRREVVTFQGVNMAKVVIATSDIYLEMDTLRGNHTVYCKYTNSSWLVTEETFDRIGEAMHGGEVKRC